jgi:hypothetical protein
LKKLASVLLLAFLAGFILLSGCMGPQEIVEHPNGGLPAEPGKGVPPLVPEPQAKDDGILEGLGLVSEIPVEFQLEVDLVYSGDGKPAYSYLGAFAMLAREKDSSINFQDIVAASGVGTQALHLEEENLLVDGYSVAAMSNAAKNLGFEYYLSGLSGVTFTNDLGSDLALQAKEKFALASAEDSLGLLKRLIASGVPVAVNLDVYYLRDALASHSLQWQETIGALEGKHKSHFFVVTGFDEETIYLNDSTEKDSKFGKDVGVPLSGFESAWENGNHNLVEEEFRLGPNWMLFLGSERQAEKSYVEIARWNAEVSKEAALNIASFAANPNVDERHNCVEMQVARVHFSNWLRAHGFHSAADKFNSSGIFFKRLCLSLANQNRDLESIASVEEAGLNYLEVV